MPCIFSKDDEKVILERKILVLKRKAKNPARLVKESKVYYLPISLDIAQRLRLDDGDFVKVELAKVQKKEEPITV